MTAFDRPPEVYSHEAASSTDQDVTSSRVRSRASPCRLPSLLSSPPASTHPKRMDTHASNCAHAAGDPKLGGGVELALAVNGETACGEGGKLKCESAALGPPAPPAALVDPPRGVVGAWFTTRPSTAPRLPLPLATKAPIVRGLGRPTGEVEGRGLLSHRGGANGARGAPVSAAELSTSSRGCVGPRTLFTLAFSYGVGGGLGDSITPASRPLGTVDGRGEIFTPMCDKGLGGFLPSAPGL